MGNLRHLPLVLVALACAACGTETTPPPGDPFLGSWTCDETRTLKFTAPANTPDAAAMVRTMLFVTAENGKLTAVAKNEAGASCKLEYNEMDASAVLVSGQSCMDSDGITLTYKTGNVAVGSSGLHGNVEFDFAGMLAGSMGAAPIDASGSGTTTSACFKVYVGGGGTGVGVGGGGW
jgi:hypothetical protein